MGVQHLDDDSVIAEMSNNQLSVFIDVILHGKTKMDGVAIRTKIANGVLVLAVTAKIGILFNFIASRVKLHLLALNVVVNLNVILVGKMPMVLLVHNTEN